MSKRESSTCCTAYERPGPDEAKEAVTVLANLATLIGDKLEALSGNLIVMQSGKLIGQTPAGQ